MPDLDVTSPAVMRAGVIHEHAPAKINLALHVTGQRADGYHLLDTLVTFADAGDRLAFSAAGADDFRISGRFAGGLPTDAAPKGGNLVLRARDLLRGWAEDNGFSAPPVAIHLEKNLPIASGIGGGSADAAAVVRGLRRLWRLDLQADRLQEIALALGADVPMCLASRPLVARGIGEEIRLLADFPKLHLLLVNPLVEVSTPAIFKLLPDKHNPPLALPDDGAAANEWIEALQAARNDLQPPAERLAPEIAETMEVLRSTRPLVARMSGSGATCFAIYGRRDESTLAESMVAKLKPSWYCQASVGA
jgi:4-diphosphocytidyl-2-C-methyl-D-erythritol kinase